MALGLSQDAGEGIIVPTVTVTIMQGTSQTESTYAYISGFNHTWNYVYVGKNHGIEFVETGELGYGKEFGPSYGRGTATIYIY